eukprot:m.150982 g.150982  ORF g.150982 m.150982 type:complete len:961 (+) comp38561_c0_seq22:358-3240(+)
MDTEEVSLSLRDIAIKKELEWRDALEQHVRSLEIALNEKEKRLSGAETQLSDLQTDFEFNLKVIEARDAELEQYEATFSSIREREAIHAAEVSDLMIRLDEMRKEVELEHQTREDMRIHYRERLQEKQDEWEEWRKGKEAEIRAEKEENAVAKKRLQEQLGDLSIELESQRRELTVRFDDVLAKERREFGAELDEWKGKCREREEESRRMDRELESVRSGREKTGNELEEVEHVRVDLERQLKEAKWELKDVSCLKDAQIKDLHDEAQRLQRVISRAQEEHGDLDRCLKERDAQIQGLKESQAEAEVEYRNAITKLESGLSTQKHNQKQLQWAHCDAMTEKERLMQKLQAQMNECWQQCEQLHKELTHLKTGHSLKLAALGDEKAQLMTEVARRDADVNRYKREVAAGLEREHALEQAKVHLELDWKRKCREQGETERIRQEDMIAAVCRARDEALATVRRQEKELSERDQLIEEMKEDCDGDGGTERKELEEQNDRLRDVVRQMREGMEGLVADNDGRGNGDELREENERLRQENAQLKTAVTATVFPGKDDVVEQAPLVKAHVRALGDTIGALRSEKIDTLAEVERQKVKVGHLSKMLTKTEEELRQRQLTIEKLEYEFSVGQKRRDRDVDELKRCNAELELALAQARREADQYYKENLSRNMEAAALANQVSALKIELASCSHGNPSVDYAVTVAQLEDEIFRLKGRLESDVAIDDDGGSGSASASALKQKLKSATKKIIDLSRDRQQLIDIGNMLRAEVNRKSGGERHMESKTLEKRPISVSAPVSQRRGVQNRSGQVKSKLNALENLQYELTKRELQFAQYPSLVSPRVNPVEEPSSAGSLVAEDGVGGGSKSEPVAPREESLPAVQFSSSQDEGDRSSLQAVWKVLETGERQVDSFSPRSGWSADGRGLGDLAVGGQAVKFKERGGVSRFQSRKPASGHRQKSKSIRNYNWKDA